MPGPETPETPEMPDALVDLGNAVAGMLGAVLLLPAAVEKAAAAVGVILEAAIDWAKDPGPAGPKHPRCSGPCIRCDRR